MVRDTDPSPAFINADGSLLAAFVEESFRSASRYAVYLRDPRREVCATEFPHALQPDRALANSRPLMAECRDMDRPPGFPANPATSRRRHAAARVTGTVTLIHVDAR